MGQCKQALSNLKLIIIERAMCLRVDTHRIRNAPKVLLDGCYAFIALIILFLGLFYQGTLDRAPIEESTYQFWSKTDRNGRTYEATGVVFYTRGKLEL